MQQEFNNEKNSKAAHGALKAILKICFWLSTISSTVSLAIFSYSLTKPLITGFIGDFMHLASIAAWTSVAAVAYFCYIVDFLIIHIAGTYFATETFAFIAAKNGVFTSFKTLRAIPILLWGLVFSAGFALSFVTSWHGSELIEGFAAPKVNAKQYDGIIAERDKQATSATKLQDEKLVKLEADKKAAIANAGNPELKKQAKKGDAWANTELEKQQTAAAKAYDRQIAATEKARTAAVASFEQRYSGIEKAKIAAADADVNKTMSQANAISALTKGFGVLPLVIGVIGLIILAISEVSNAASKSGRTVAGFAAKIRTTDGHQRKRKSGEGLRNF